MIRNKLRQYISRVVALFLVMVITAQVVTSIAYAETVDTWIDGRFPVLADTVPQTYAKTCYSSSFTYQSFTNSNNDPTSVLRDVEHSVCASRFGSSQLLGSSTGAEATADFIGVGYSYRILGPNGAPSGVGRVPNQNIFTYGYNTGQTIYGSSTSLAIGYNFAKYGSFGNYLVGGSNGRNEMAYKLTSPPQPLRDTNGRILDFRENRRFSGNGEWMIAEVAGVGIIRVNMLTQQMQVVEPSYRPLYDQGWVPYIGLAISNDGNTVMVGKRVFDLRSCAQVTPTFSGSTNAIAGCRSRDLSSNLANQLPGFDAFYDLRFSNDGMRLTGRAAYYVLGIRTTKWVAYSVYGYQPQQGGYIALGDSFSSGEGAYNYEPATDSGDPRNRCHVSKDSYPYLAAASTRITDFHSVACSGAETVHYYSKNQYSVPDDYMIGWNPGYSAQKKYLEVADNPGVVTISMIGNDIGFSEKLTWCAVRPDSCYHFKEDREALAKEIQGKFGTLTDLYMQIKYFDAPGAKVYVLGYPQLFGTGTDCGLTATFDHEERLMSRGLITYLNSVIHAAAENAGVMYIDVENAFVGHRICESGEKAVNRLRADGLHRSAWEDLSPVSTESFHPNKLGHQLMTEALLAQSDNFSYAMPAPDWTKQAPDKNSYAYNELIGSAPNSGQFLSRQLYVAQATADKVTKTSPMRIVTDNIFKVGARIRAEFRSEPTYAGELIADENGNINAEITVPASLPPGYHTLHLLGQDTAGEPVDVYKVIYVAASENDIDGDGIPNDQEKCLAVESSGTDYDQDGIDDACDGEITEPPRDTVAPVVTGTMDRMPNGNGWYNADVNIDWTSADPDPSSGAPVKPPIVVVSLEGEHTYTSGHSCDPSGNCATGIVTLKIDKTAPVIDFSLSQPPNADGWNSHAVIVTFICSDSISGVEVCSDPVEVSTEGTTVVMGSVRDKAGNVGEVAAFVSIDSAKPDITYHVTPDANDYGWNNTDVAMSYECSDGLSGIDSCTSPAVFDTEGADQVTVGTAIDRAGNKTSINTRTINIDKTAPTLESFGWQSNLKSISSTTSLTVPFSDNLSGVVRAEYFLGDTDPGYGHGATMNVEDQHASTTFGTDFPVGVYKVTVRVQDRAGNWSPVLSDYLVVYDPDGPRFIGKRSVLPSITNGDVLPGLGAESVAQFAFSVRYDKDGHISKNSDFQFKYSSNAKCSGSKQDNTCNRLELNASSIEWMLTQGANNSLGTFQGTGIMIVDGVNSRVIFRLKGADGERISLLVPDQFELQIFAAVADPNTANPLYKIAPTTITRGNIKIK